MKIEILVKVYVDADFYIVTDIDCYLHENLDKEMMEAIGFRISEIAGEIAKKLIKSGCSVRVGEFCTFFINDTDFDSEGQLKMDGVIKKMLDASYRANFVKRC